MGLNLLEKTELWINNIVLDNTNLTELASIVAKVLGLEDANVLVVDVRPQHITLDILQEEIQEENIIGKENVILEELSKLNGVTITKDTYIHSNGVLGMICLDIEDPENIINSVQAMTNEMKERISKRAIVFATGFELQQNLIEDTNTPYLKSALEEEGYKVTIGDIIEDDIDDMIFKLSDAISRAFGIVITTGGVGAEDKDKSVESVLKVDPSAATPYIVKFQQGTGRHVKDGVRIAVGQVGPTLIVSLPGPNDEVKIATQILLDCLKSNCNKDQIAQKIANALVKKLVQKGWDHHHKMDTGFHHHQGHH